MKSSSIDMQRTANNSRRTESKLAQATHRLSSGYRINSAADDAAGLAISEKLRAIDRGLRQGMRNINDGISYIDTVDGAAQEMNNMLHRMKEIAVEAANGIYDDRIDRGALDAEYQQLIDEIEQMTDTAEFNGIPLFERHYPEYERDDGSVVHEEPITIDGSNDTLVLGYTINGEKKEYTIEIPRGDYTVEELADVIDTGLFGSNDALIIGVNDLKQLTMQCEGGKLDYISGNASSLFYDTVIGSADGYLLGVTTFYNDTSAPLEIISGKNDVIAFRLGNEDDTIYSITLDPGEYLRPALVQAINEKLDAAGLPCKVEAVMQDNDDGKKIIGLKSEKTMTGLTGNFLMIDGGRKPIHSPIYDICCYSTLVNSEATLIGTKSVTAGVEIERGRNDYFVLDAGWYNSDGTPETRKLHIDLLDPGENLRTYANGSQLVDRISEQLEALGCPIEVELTAGGGLQFTTLQYGKECKIKLDTSDVPSGYMVCDLFDSAALKVLCPNNSTSAYTAACFNARKQLGSSIIIPTAHNQLSFTVGVEQGGGVSNETLVFDIPAGTYTQAQLNTALNDMLAANYPDLSSKLYFNVGSTLTLSANGIAGSDITSITANTSAAYSRLIYGPVYTDNIDASHSTGSEKDLVSYGSGVPGTSRPNVTSTAGKTETAVTYTSVSNPVTSQQTGNYLIYSSAAVSYVQGKTDYTGAEGEVIPWDSERHTPATMTLKGVLSQFTVEGTSMRDTPISFQLSDRSGNISAYSVDIPKGCTAAQAVDKLNETLAGVATITASGSDLVFTSVQKGEKVDFSNASGDLNSTATKNSLASQPGVEVDKANNRVYKPATLTLSAAGSHLPLTVGTNNDSFKFRAGSHTYDIALTHKTYSSLSEIAEELNAKIAAADGGSAASKVTVSGSSLVITGPARESGISYDASSTCRLDQRKNVNNVASSPYYDPATGNAEIPATIRAEGIDSHFPLTVDSSNNTITMDYTIPDPANPGANTTENLTITIPAGTYSTAQAFTNAVNSAIAADPALNGKITASYSSSGSNKGLTFTTVNGGSGYSLANLGGTAKINLYKTTNSSSGGTVSSGENKIKYPAYIQNTQFNTLFTGEGVEINDLNNFVSLKINGTDYKFTIPEGEYAGSAGQSALLSALENGLSGAGVTVSVSGNTLKITTDEVGTSATISLNPDNTAPYFKRAQSCSLPQQINRDSRPCQLIGMKTVTTIDIEDYFNEMKFTYTENGTTAEVNVTVPPGSYTAAQLAAAIQSSIDDTLPANSLAVGVSGGHLTITGVGISDSRGISDFSGRLFDRVFQEARYNSVSKHTEKIGTTTGSAVSYIVGRNDLQPETAEEIESGNNVIIYTGLNDGLIFDLTYKGTRYKVDCKIPAGHYGPQQLASAVQSAGRSALSTMTDVNGDPLPADYFHATIGLDPLGITQSGNTAISPSDKLVLSYVLPDNGTIKVSDAVIDGVRGSSAYRIFYDATQSPQPSRVIGKADLSNGVNIQAGVNDRLSLDLDGESITVTIPAGAYTCKGVSDELNRQYEKLGCIIRTVDNNGRLMFYTTENGAYHIERFTGNAADDLFYGADKRDDDDEIGIHTGRRTDSYIWYNKTRADDHLMRINTTGVTTIERALKAISRLDYANNYLLKWRALSGAIHNRSEYTYERNQNYVENLEAAESGIRDADIPGELAKASKEKLIMQAQSYILTTQKDQQQSVLDIMA
ncbi:MAG: flagellin [Oscillospiraceae bacterium]